MKFEFNTKQKKWVSEAGSKVTTAELAEIAWHHPVVRIGMGRCVIHETREAQLTVDLSDHNGQKARARAK